MIGVADGLFVGPGGACRAGSAEMAVVHACKHPCHRRALGYRNNLPTSHPHYLLFEQEFDLYLNIIDPEEPLFKPLHFTTFLDFARRQREAGRPLLVHCNQGVSRSPSLALLFMAKQMELISNDSYAQASVEFAQCYPRYQPGRGIQTFLTEHWALL